MADTPTTPTESLVKEIGILNKKLTSLEQLLSQTDEKIKGAKAIESKLDLEYQEKQKELKTLNDQLMQINKMLAESVAIKQIENTIKLLNNKFKLEMKQK